MTAIGYLFWLFAFIGILEKVGEKINNYYVGIVLTILIMCSMLSAAEWFLLYV